MGRGGELSIPDRSAGSLAGGVARYALEADFVALDIATAARLSGTAARTEAQEPKTRGYFLRRALAIADALGLALAFFFTQFAISQFEVRDLKISALLVPGILGWVLLAKMYGLYEREEAGIGASAADELPALFLLGTLFTWAGILLIDLLDLASTKVQVASVFWLVSIALMTTLRVGARAAVQRRGVREKAVIIGTGNVARRLADKLRSRDLPIEVVGFVDDDPLDLPDDAPPYLGSTVDLEQIVRAYDVERVLVAFSRAPGEEQVDLLRRCNDLNVRADIVPRMYEVLGARTHFHDVAGIPLISVKPPGLSRSTLLIKRGLDLVIVTPALALLSPFLLFAAWRIKRDSPGPVLFRQERMGAGGRRFEIMKFRSMYSDADDRKHEVGHLNMHCEDGPRMFKVAGDPRITPFGRFLRKWSLDELPQLLNVLRGEMSLVGPRPLILVEDENILGPHRHRLNIKPGITGLWQVLGRSEIPFSEMIALDYLYVTNWSLWGDIKLLARTIPAVLAKRGAY